MSPEKTKQLYDKYPGIFAERSLSPDESCMAFGLECDDGWYDLLDVLCSLIMWETKYDENMKPVVALQVKEKFGTLRFYYRGGNDAISSYVTFAENMSGRTCEVCGSVGSVRDGGWLRTLCDQHAKELGYELSS